VSIQTVAVTWCYLSVICNLVIESLSFTKHYFLGCQTLVCVIKDGVYVSFMYVLWCLSQFVVPIEFY